MGGSIDIEVYSKYIGNEEIVLLKSIKNDTPFHRHNFLEIAYVVEGSAIHYFNNERRLIKKGEYFAIDYDEIHKFSPNGDDSFAVINCLFHPEFIDIALKGCRSLSEVISNYLIKFNYANLKTPPSKCIFYDENSVIESLFKKALNEYAEKAPGFREIIRCYLVEILITTLRTLYTDKIFNNSNETINKIVSYINENFAGDISLASVCDKIGYSIPYISNLFRQVMGMSFIKYLQKVRIEKSCHLLAYTDKSIDIIANLVGYEDVKYFRKIFKRSLNISPREFRDKYRPK